MQRKERQGKTPSNEVNATPEQIEKYLAEAERIVRKQAASGSLTEKILDGWFGEESKKSLFIRKAKELAMMDKH